MLIIVAALDTTDLRVHKKLLPPPLDLLLSVRLSERLGPLGQHGLLPLGLQVEEKA